MHSKAINIQNYFSNNYSEGRTRFLNACEKNNLTVKSFIHPNHKGPSKEDLAADTAWIGPKNAAKVLMVLCGTHGLEASTGAATILQFLETTPQTHLPDNTAILLVHPVNPYGWAYDRRGNEDGIDLNRNFLDHTKPYPANPAYDTLHSLIKSANVDEDGLIEFTATFHRYVETYGMAQAVSGITAGQYKHPDGMSFGGSAPSWSVQTLFKIANQYLTEAKNVILLDWHTGIGDFGKPYFIMDAPVLSAEFKRASSWWLKHNIHSDDILDGASPNYTGLLIKGMKEKIKYLNQVEITSVVIEWGTYKLDAMLQSLLMDDWLKSNRDIDASITKQVRIQLRDRFCPENPDWRQAVLKQAPTLYMQALEGLKNW
ncbi:MAG: hypothetical protein COB56_01570 [Robiginitomaculum sp.]|nr:MAG: hypothetical protein COB56_01570 [Robiginitomaculum sp.]